MKSLIGEGTARFAGGRVARCRVLQELDSERSQALFLFLEKACTVGERVGKRKRHGKGAYAEGLPKWGPQSAGRIRDAIPSFVLSQGKRGEIKDIKDFNDIKDALCESRV